MTKTKTMEKLLAVEKRLAAFAKKLLAEGKEFQPMMEIEDEDGEKHALVLIDLFIPEMWDQKRLILQNVLKRFKAVSYVLASEAWMLGVDHNTIKFDNEGKPVLEQPISKDERRKSILVINGENKQGELIFSTRIINEDTTPRTLQEPPHVFQTFDSFEDEGRLMGEHTGLLEPEKRTLN